MDLFLFDILIILLIVIDMHNYEKQITPLTIFGGVYTCLINLNNLVISKVYAFIPINAHALWVIFSFFIIIFCIDFAEVIYIEIRHIVAFCSLPDLKIMRV